MLWNVLWEVYFIISDVLLDALASLFLLLALVVEFGLVIWRDVLIVDDVDILIQIGDVHSWQFDVLLRVREGLANWLSWLLSVART